MIRLFSALYIFYFTYLTVCNDLNIVFFKSDSFCFWFKTLLPIHCFWLFTNNYKASIRLFYSSLSQNYDTSPVLIPSLSNLLANYFYFKTWFFINKDIKNFLKTSLCSKLSLNIFTSVSHNTMLLCLRNIHYETTNMLIKF